MRDVATLTVEEVEEALEAAYEAVLDKYGDLPFPVEELDANFQHQLANPFTDTLQ